MLNYKNYLLLSTFVISHLYTIFRGSKERVDWWILIDFTRRIDYAVMYYGIAINFLIMSFCLHYNNHISKKVSRFILLTCILDFIHLVTVSKINFGVSKIFVAFIIYYIYEKTIKNG